jgi:YegS/Rv2252/BmrU family lipid kinase
VTGIIFNPTARGEKATRFRRHLGDLGDEVRIVPTRCAGDAREIAAELVTAGCDPVVAAGGDGTVNEVLNGICDVPGGLERTRLGVIPLGTINVFAKETGIPGDFPGAWKVIQAGKELLMDLPCAEFSGPDGTRVRRHFILMAGAGLDSSAIELVDWNLKKKVGPLAYVWAGIRAMQRPHPAIEVAVDGRRHTVELAEIGNGRFYGGRFPVFPDARLDDGEFDATLFPRVNWPCALRVFLRLLVNRLATSPDAILLRARELHLSAPTPVPLQLDGDIVGTLPATITLRPRTLRVLRPAAIANSQ